MNLKRRQTILFCVVLCCDVRYFDNELKSYLAITFEHIIHRQQNTDFVETNNYKSQVTFKNKQIKNDH